MNYSIYSYYRRLCYYNSSYLIIIFLVNFLILDKIDKIDKIKIHDHCEIIKNDRHSPYNKIVVSWYKAIWIFLPTDLLIKIIEMLTENIDKTLLSIENRIAHLDNLIEDDSLLDVIFYNHKIKCSPEIPCMSLYIRKNVKPKKMKIMVNNKICYVPYDVYDVYDISYGYILFVYYP
jgi:hypothetical protein